MPGYVTNRATDPHRRDAHMRDRVRQQTRAVSAPVGPASEAA